MFGFNINYGWQDDAIASVNVFEAAPLESHGLLGAAISWNDIEVASLPGTLSLLLWGRNLTDEEYATINGAGFAFLGADELTTFGDPRSYGLTLSYQYY